MFTDGLDPSALKWVQGDLHKATMASSMLASSIDMLSPTLENFPGRSRGLPPTQFRHSGLLHRSPLLTTSSEELNESVGSVSADTFDSDNESEPLSIDSSHYARRHLSSTQQDDDGLLMESQSVVHESSYYEYTKRLTSRSTSKPESKCNSRRESFGRSEGKQQSPPSKNGEHRSADESSFSEDDRRTFYEHLEEEEEEEEEELAICDGIAELRLNRSSTLSGCVPPMEKSEQMHQRITTTEGNHVGEMSPSAPPMIGSVNVEDADSDTISSTSNSSGQIYDEFLENQESFVRVAPTRMGETCTSSENLGSDFVKAEDPTINQVATSSTNKHATPYLSGPAAWQALIAYDACVRLCLRAWAKGCMEAPEFLLNECLVLRNAFGLQHLLLQPHEDAVQTIDTVDAPATSSIPKSKSSSGRIKVQVRKVRIFSRQALQGISSQRSAAYVQAGAQYVRQVSDIVKTGVKHILSTTPLEAQEGYACILRLKSMPDEPVETHLGSGDTHFFYPESSDNLLLDIFDSKRNPQGQAVVQLALQNDDMNDHVRWWPIFGNADHDCVGKVQLYISYSANGNECSSTKWSPVGETLAYDIVLGVALRINSFHQRNLRLHGAWKWLLSEFGVFYGVSHVYASLRYLAFVMEVATPTEDCLVLIHDLLCPIMEAQVETTLSRQEKRMLNDAEDQVEQLLVTVFENYKSLDETSSSGITESLTPVSGKASPALVPAVKIFTLLHDILFAESQRKLCSYFQGAAKKRCRRYMAETDEFFSGSYEGFLMDPMTISTAYAKLKTLCTNICNEVKTDITLHNEHILPSSIDLPNITAEVYCSELSNRLRSFLVACPPAGPSPPVVELLIATADLQQDLISWKIRPSKGKVDAKDLFHPYIELWVQERRLNLLEYCKLDKVRWTGPPTSNGTSPFLEEMYDRIKDTLNEYDTLLNRWPEYTLHLEAAIADVEIAAISALEKHYAESLSPLKDVMVTKKFSIQYMQKLTRRRSLSLYSVPHHVGTFLNTIKRVLDTLHPKIDAQMKSWVACVPAEVVGKANFGERLNEVTILLRAKYKNFIQAIVEKLADNARLHATTKLKKILHDTREAGEESEIRDRMHPLSVQLLDTISNLHDVFAARVLVAVSRGYWDRMGQEVLHFLENRKENRSSYKGSHFALLILDDIFASQMQKLLGHALQEKDVEPPRSILEARSLISRDVPNGFDSSNYLYF